MQLLDYMQAKRLLDSYGIRSIGSKYVESAEEAVKFASRDAIVLKIISEKALHKSKSGLVALGLNSDAKIRSAFDRLVKKARQLKPYKILAQKMVGNGLEIIVGGKVDPQFGKLLLVGLGGIYVETFKDFALRLCPVSRDDARAMLRQLKSGKVIAPNKKSEDALVSLLEKASALFYDNDAEELDLNPIILHDGTYDAVDLRMLMK